MDADLGVRSARGVSPRPAQFVSLLVILAVLLGGRAPQPAKAAGPISYVKPGGTGDCSSWAQACDLRTAVNNTGEIWVSRGVYVPTDTGKRDKTFQLRSGTQIYGGFGGSETARSQRNPRLNATILSGDIGTTGDRSDNSYNVVLVPYAASALLDGLIITGGNADGAAPTYDRGGGIHSSGITTVKDVTLVANRARYGGGMKIEFYSSTLTNVTFTDNRAFVDGGGLYNAFAGSAVLTNVTFEANEATDQGGAVFNDSYNAPTFRNVTISANSAPYGGAIANNHSAPAIYNSIMWNNDDEEFYNTSPVAILIMDSIVEGGCPDELSVGCVNVIDADPVLGGLANNGGWTNTMALGSGSAALDAGGVNAPLGSTCAPTDQRGITRPQGTACDIGAYEMTQPRISGHIFGLSAAQVVTVNVTHTNPNTTVHPDSSGFYSFWVTDGWTGTVTPSLSGRTFTPVSRSYSNLHTDQENQDFTVNVNISGSITGLPTSASNSNINLTLHNDDGSPDQILHPTGSGGTRTYSIPVPYNFSGTLTPSYTGYTFVAPPTTDDHREYSNLIADIPSQDFTASVIMLDITGTFTATGSPPDWTGVVLSWTDGVAKTTNPLADGTYTVSVPYGWTGTITPALDNFSFTPPNRVYTNSSSPPYPFGVIANVSGQDYLAKPAVHISGKIYSTGVGLRDSSGNTISSSRCTSDVTLSWNDSGAQMTHPSWDGSNCTYTITVPSGWSGQVSFQLAGSLSGLTRTPPSITYPVLTVDQTNQDYHLPLIIAGRVNDLSSSLDNNVTLTWTGAGGPISTGVSQSSSSSSRGWYLLRVPYSGGGTTGTVTPSSTDPIVFTPPSISYPSITVDQTGQDYTWAYQQFTISASPAVGAGGSITPSLPVLVPALSSQTFTITPSATYVVQDVLVDAASQGRIGYYTFDNVVANHTMSALFDGGWAAPSASTNTSVSNANNAYVSDGQRAEWNSNSDVAYYSTFGFSIPAGSIDGIEVAIEGYRSSNSNPRNAVVSLSWNNGTNYSNTMTTALPGTSSSSEATVILGGPTNTWGHPWANTEFADGVFRVRVQSQSPSGFNSLFIDQIQVKVYYTASLAPLFSAPLGFGATLLETGPGLEISSTAVDPTNASPIPVTFTFTADVTGFDATDIVVGNGAVTPGSFAGSGASYSADITPAGEGQVTVDVGAGAAQDTSAVDNLAAPQFEITYDITAPTVSIATGPDDPTSSTSADFTFTTGGDPIQLDCQLDGAAYAACGGDTAQSYAGPLDNGSHTFTVRAVDAAGNSSTDSYTWTVDVTGPDALITSAPPSPNSPTATFTFTSPEVPVHFECQLDGGGFEACASPKTYDSLADGSHSFEVRALDDLNNPGIPSSANWVINGPPQVVEEGLKTTLPAPNNILGEGQVVDAGVTQFTITFSSSLYDPSGNTDHNDVTNPANYLLVRDDGDGFQTSSCAQGVQPTDTAVTIDSVTYDDSTFTVTLTVNGGLPLSNGVYRLYACGTTSLVDAEDHDLKLAGDGKNAGTDYVRDFIVADPESGGGNRSGSAGEDASVASSAVRLPTTGFPPGAVTLPWAAPQERSAAAGGMLLEIPSLSVKAPIVGIARQGDGWQDLSGLGNNAGYLEGSAYPTWPGNTVLTGHVIGADGAPGIFAQLKELQANDRVSIHAGGQVFVYQVRENKLVSPVDVAAVFQHKTYNWVTLLTCEDWIAEKNAYASRRIVRAVLISVYPEE